MEDYLFSHDALKPLSENDGGRRVAVCRSDRPDCVVDTKMKKTMKNDFVFVDEFVSGIRWDAKYATWDNFTVKPVDGYAANLIVGTRAFVRNPGKSTRKRRILWLWLASLAYRPQCAIDCFLRWSKQPEDSRTKLKHYPNIDKAVMVEKGYVVL